MHLVLQHLSSGKLLSGVDQCCCKGNAATTGSMVCWFTAFSGACQPVELSGAAGSWPCGHMAV